MKYIHRYWYVVFCIAIVALALAAEMHIPRAVLAVDIIVGGILLIAGIIVFIVICFWVTSWISLGNPFWERGDKKPVIMHRDYRKPDTKKVCPICKRPTRCSVKKSDDGRFWVHVHKEN